jgi:23S rRNA (uracil1939-C5)-methyltransferase
MPTLKRKQEVQVSIEKIAFGGKGIAYLDDFVIFIKDTLPGDLVKARVFKKKMNYAEAKLLAIISPSPLRITPPCPYFSWCGGCIWQNITYEEQLRIKRQHVTESVTHIAGIDNTPVLPPLPSHKIWAYRNKMEFSFSDHRWFLPDELGNPDLERSFVLGLHVSGTFDKIINIDHCLLQSDSANKVLRTVFSYCKQYHLVPYSLKLHTGFLRFLVIRESQDSGSLMINLVTAYEDQKSLWPLAKHVMQVVPEVVSFINTINDRKAQIACGDREIVIAGEKIITDKLFDLHFKISANSFFQTNTVQAEKLYQTVLDFCASGTGDIIWDLYCGTGTITIFLTRHAKKVIGFEMEESALTDARLNAQVHGISNIEFIAGDLAQSLPHTAELPDIIVVDPPRSGMHPKVTRFLSQIKTGKIIYVSCNPTTMARDLQTLTETYELVKVQPVDMFPHTYHIESVALLERKDR